MVIQASVIMALVMVAVVCVTVAFARFLSRGLTEPVIQLVDIVRSLNNMDFSRQVRAAYSLQLPPRIYTPCLDPLLISRALLQSVRTSSGSSPWHSFHAINPSDSTSGWEVEKVIEGLLLLPQLMGSLCS